MALVDPEKSVVRGGRILTTFFSESCTNSLKRQLKSKIQLLLLGFKERHRRLWFSRGGGYPSGSAH